VTRHFVVGVAVDAAFSAALADPRNDRLLAEFGRGVDSLGVDFLLIAGERLVRSRSRTVALDPSVVATLLARHTERVGVVPAAAPPREHPFNIARRIASLDHGTHGRAGWLVGAVDHSAPVTERIWTAADSLHAAEDAILVARELWGSWPADSIVNDADRGVYAESEHIVHIDHVGAYSIAGPLNVPEPPQSQIPVFWRPLDDSELISARRHADVVIVADEPAARGYRATHDPDARRDQVLLVDRRGSSAARIDIPTAADGVVAHGATVANWPDFIAALSRRVVDENRVTLRDRLGLSVPERALAGGRSAFPAA